jgi:hypothetical protein
LSYIGINSQLADSAALLSTGNEYTVYLGGRNLDAKDLKIEFNSRFFKVSRNPIAEPNFGEGISVVSLVVSVDENTPAGVYSIFATGADGIMGSLVGGISIR